METPPETPAGLEDQPPVGQETYRGYELLARAWGGQYVAVASKGEIRVFVAAGETLEESLESVRTAIDEALAPSSEDRIGEVQFLKALRTTLPSRTDLTWYLLDRIRALHGTRATLPQLGGGTGYTADELMSGLHDMAEEIAGALPDSAHGGPADRESAAPLAVAVPSETGLEFEFDRSFVSAVRRYLKK